MPLAAERTWQRNIIIFSPSLFVLNPLLSLSCHSYYLYQNLCLFWSTHAILCLCFSAHTFSFPYTVSSSHQRFNPVRGKTCLSRCFNPVRYCIIHLLTQSNALYMPGTVLGDRDLCWTRPTFSVLMEVYSVKENTHIFLVIFSIIDLILSWKAI